MLRVKVSTILSCPPEKTWREVQKVELLQRVISPLATIASRDNAPLPKSWEAGKTYYLRCTLFGLIPLGIRKLYIERLDADTHDIQSRESDGLVRTWDHHISIRPHGKSQTLYTDDIEIDAGALTWLVWAWASIFYRHRQRKWRRLAGTL